MGIEDEEPGSCESLDELGYDPLRPARVGSVTMLSCAGRVVSCRFH